MRSIPEGQAVAELIALASAGGWGFLPTARATFDDLPSTGALSLISDPDLRFAIADCYRSYEWGSQRTNARRSRFPALAYEMVPHPMGNDFISARSRWATWNVCELRSRPQTAGSSHLASAGPTP